MPIATARSAGLRKFIPQPDRYAERYGRFTLTARDIEILDVVHRYRYLEARHIRAIVGGSGQQITRRLQGLFHGGYVGRYARRERMRLDLGSGAPLMAYGLETNGARALGRHRIAAAAASGGEPEPVRWRKDYTRRTEWFLEHQLMISNFRCVLELALRETSGVDLLCWKQGEDTWFRVAIPGEQRRVVSVAPDAYFVLRSKGQVRHFYLEADRSTEERRRLVHKFIGYWWHLQDPGFLEAGDRRSRVNVLFVSTGQRRLRNMINTLERMPKPNRARHGGKGLFWFYLNDHATIDDPSRLLDPGWRSATQRDGSCSLA